MAETLRCKNLNFFQVICGHGNWHPCYSGCGKWSCESCAHHRLGTELVPQVKLALLWARERGETLKHVVLTYRGSDLGAQPTKEGAKRRREDFAHFVQSYRREGKLFEYLNVSESHKSGKIHMHVLAVMPYEAHAAMSKRWSRFARGSNRLSINAAGMRCPQCWPGHDASQERKRASMVIPPPGRGCCANCGYRPDWSDEAEWDRVAWAVAWEAGKYLTKEAYVAGVRKKLTRSKGWIARCTPQEKEKEVCPDCETVHQVVWAGSESHLVEKEGIDLAVIDHACFVVRGGSPCECWGRVAWRLSVAASPELWLWDFIEPVLADTG